MNKPRWFSHDCTARQDQKLLLLRDKWGDAGVAWYWYLIETLMGQDNLRFPTKLKLLSELSLIPEKNISDFIYDLKKFNLIIFKY